MLPHHPTRSPGQMATVKDPGRTVASTGANQLGTTRILVAMPFEEAVAQVWQRTQRLIDQPWIRWCYEEMTTSHEVAEGYLESEMLGRLRSSLHATARDPH